MANQTLLEKYGLFDAKVPRFTSYPPANRFDPGAGQANQVVWLEETNQSEPVSLYVHIPFCRRLCWFCACRTQGTKTLSPVAEYVETLVREIKRVAGHLRARKMVRLHLGGGTPTLLTIELMDRLLDAIHAHFEPTRDYEFSVEIDPTEAAPALLSRLSEWNMTRASVGVQDFSEEVQSAIGRPQSFAVTHAVVRKLRHNGVGSVNLDLLYGLPFQTPSSLAEALGRVEELAPDRIALCGYAHVPQVSKRQQMIDADMLPDPYARLDLARQANERLQALGYIPLGIDHYARRNDSLTQAAKRRTMRRNFQGYTDDPAATLLGFGASAISRFYGGYSQNAVATAAYRGRIEAGALAGQRGYVLTTEDRAIARLIEDLMCYQECNIARVCAETGYSKADLERKAVNIAGGFPGVTRLANDHFTLDRRYLPLTRIIAARAQAVASEPTEHCLAV